MPLINVKVIEGVFSSSQRREIVQKLTDAMVSIEGENMRGVTWCVLEEVHSGDWAIGGNALTTQDVQALAAGATRPAPRSAEPTTARWAAAASIEGPRPPPGGFYPAGTAKSRDGMKALTGFWPYRKDLLPVAELSGLAWDGAPSGVVSRERDR